MRVAVWVVLFTALFTGGAVGGITLVMNGFELLGGLGGTFAVLGSAAWGIGASGWALRQPRRIRWSAARRSRSRHRSKSRR